MKKSIIVGLNVRVTIDAPEGRTSFGRLKIAAKLVEDLVKEALLKHKEDTGANIEIFVEQDYSEEGE